MSGCKSVGNADFRLETVGNASLNLISLFVVIIIFMSLFFFVECVMQIADEADPAAKLWNEYIRLYDRLEKLTDPKAMGDPRLIGDLIDRARCVMADLSFAKPTTPLGAVASLYAAKHFASEAMDTNDEDERDNLHRAAERCIEAAMAVLEARASTECAPMLSSVR